MKDFYALNKAIAHLVYGVVDHDHGDLLLLAGHPDVGEGGGGGVGGGGGQAGQGAVTHMVGHLKTQ